MIIKLSQTDTPFKKTAFDITGTTIPFSGEYGGVSQVQSLCLKADEYSLTGKFILPTIKDYVPYRHLFGKENITQHFQIFKSEEPYGHFYLSSHGLYKTCYKICLTSGETFYCYFRTIKDFCYISIYLNDVQIALVEVFLSLYNDRKREYKLYLLDDYIKYTDSLTLFVIYYANHNFDTGHSSSIIPSNNKHTHLYPKTHLYKGTSWTYSYSHSRYNNKYDPKWRETHFPYENFFGRLDKFADIVPIFKD